MKNIVLIIFSLTLLIGSFSCRKDWVKEEDVVGEKQNIIEYKIKSHIVIIDSLLTPQLINDSIMVINYVPNLLKEGEIYFCEFTSNRLLFLGFKLISFHITNNTATLKYEPVDINLIFDSYNIEIFNFDEIIRTNDNCFNLGRKDLPGIQNTKSGEKETTLKYKAGGLVNYGMLCYLKLNKANNKTDLKLEFAECNIIFEGNFATEVAFTRADKSNINESINIPFSIPIPGLPISLCFDLEAYYTMDFNANSDGNFELTLPFANLSFQLNDVEYNDSGIPISFADYQIKIGENITCFPMIFKKLELNLASKISAVVGMKINVGLGPLIVAGVPCPAAIGIGFNVQLLKIKAEVISLNKLIEPNICLMDYFKTDKGKIDYYEPSTDECLSLSFDVRQYLWLNVGTNKFEVLESSFLKDALNIDNDKLIYFQKGNNCSERVKDDLDIKLVDYLENSISSSGGLKLNIIYRNRSENFIQAKLVIKDKNSSNILFNQEFAFESSGEKYKSLILSINPNQIADKTTIIQIFHPFPKTVDQNLDEYLAYYNSNRIGVMRIDDNNFSREVAGRQWLINNVVMNLSPSINFEKYISNNDNYPFTNEYNKIIGSFIINDHVQHSICPSGYYIPTIADWENLFSHIVGATDFTIQNSFFNIGSSGFGLKDLLKYPNLGHLDVNRLKLDLKMLGIIEDLYTSISPNTARLQDVGKKVRFWTSSFENMVFSVGNEHKYFYYLEFSLSEDGKITYHFERAKNANDRALCRCIKR